MTVKFQNVCRDRPCNSVVTAIGLNKRLIALFSLYVLFSYFRPRDATPENSFFQVSSYARANVA